MGQCTGYSERARPERPPLALGRVPCGPGVWIPVWIARVGVARPASREAGSGLRPRSNYVAARRMEERFSSQGAAEAPRAHLEARQVHADLLDAPYL